MTIVSIQPVIDEIRTYAPDADLGLVMSAYVLAARAHKDQVRKTGGDYIEHPLAVALELARIRMDIETIAAGLLHDALEDNPIPREELSQAVGETVTGLVEGVTKIGKLQFRSKEQAAAENFRKLMLAMSRDPRVLIVKLADRLHNMRTLVGHRAEKRQEIARETLDVFVPFANRLGLERWKDELEELCLEIQHPDELAEIRSYLSRTLPDREAYAARVVEALQTSLARDGVAAVVKGRAKRIGSIWRKLCDKGTSIESLFDLIGFRVIVADRDSVYRAVGTVHDLFVAVGGRFKDYVSRPKANGYAGIHTTVVGPDEQRIEVQVRTEEMDNHAEEGIAAHWRYKEGRLTLSGDEIARVAHLRDLIEAAQADTSDAMDFGALVCSELGSDREIIVETPKGDLRRLPVGATVLDFAFSIHTEVGHHCQGARVNGRFTSIRHELRSGDVVEVVTDKDQRPSRDWEEIAKTERARLKIRKFLRDQESESRQRLGREMMEAELRKHGWSLERLQRDSALNDWLKAQGGMTLDALFVELASGQRPPSVLVRELVKVEPTETAIGRLLRLGRPRPPRASSPVLISEADGIAVRFARCCQPVPGEPIVGYVTLHQGITVHRAGCTQLHQAEPDRLLDTAWKGGQETRQSIDLTLICEDRKGLLAAVTGACEAQNLNIEQLATDGGRDGQALIRLRLAVRDSAELERLVMTMRRVPGVGEVVRLSN